MTAKGRSVEAAAFRAVPVVALDRCLDRDTKVVVGSREGANARAVTRHSSKATERVIIENAVVLG